VQELLVRVLPEGGERGLAEVCLEEPHHVAVRGGGPGVREAIGEEDHASREVLRDARLVHDLESGEHPAREVRLRLGVEPGDLPLQLRLPRDRHLDRRRDDGHLGRERDEAAEVARREVVDELHHRLLGVVQLVALHRARHVDDRGHAHRRPARLPVHGRRLQLEQQVEVLRLVEAELLVGEAGGRLHARKCSPRHGHALTRPVLAAIGMSVRSAIWPPRRT
jgi:hypothetical protein